MFASTSFSVVPQEMYHPAGETTTHNGWNHQPASVLPEFVYPQPRVTRFSGTTLSPPSYQPKEFHTDEQVPEWTSCNEQWQLVHVPDMKTLKRKPEDPLEGTLRKQLITEEKIAAHMSQLHIGPGPHQQKETPIPEDMSDSASTSADVDKLKSCTKVVLSEELRRLQHETSIPPSLLESFKQQNMAVVLWQPRNCLLQDLTGNDSNSQEEPSHPTQSNQAAGAEAAPSVRPRHHQQEEADEMIPVDEDDSNNNEPIRDFNHVDQMLRLRQQQLPDIDMDEDL